nr:TetR family transcriptional regulator C-terminal domain-containing protein [Anaerolineaceae bacterium]
IREMALAPYDHFRNMLATLIQKGINEGSLEPGNANTIAQAIISLSSGLFLQKLLDPDSLQAEEIVEDCVKVLIQGVLRRSL